MCKGDLITPSGGVLETPIIISSTISRASFGNSCTVRFDPTKHFEEDKVWSAKEQEWQADNQMSWYLKRVRFTLTFHLGRTSLANVIQGENVSKKDPVRSSFYRLYKTDPGRNFTVEFLQCDNVVAPERLMPSVVPLCALNCCIDKPFSDYEDFVNSKGEVMKRFDFTIEMVPSGAAVEFAVYHDRKKLGTQNTKVMFQ